MEELISATPMRSKILRLLKLPKKVRMFEYLIKYNDIKLSKINVINL